MNSKFYETYIKNLEKLLPDVDSSSLLSPHLISDQVIPLPRQAWQKIEKGVQAIYELRSLPGYQDRILESDHPFPSNQASVLMSYDFHLDTEGTPKLIEINTNASFALTGLYLYKNHALATWPHSEAQSFLLTTFEQEKKLFSDEPIQHIAIIDEQPKKQKLYIEFLLYQKLFEQKGWRCSIADYRDLQYDESQNKLLLNRQPIDFVYNRWTDFTLAKPLSEPLKLAYTNQAACFSPHPREYLLLADKQVLTLLSQRDQLAKLGLAQDQIERIVSIVPQSHTAQSFPSPEALWNERKKFFFKPQRSYGSKAAYRGKSIGRKVFQRIWEEDYLVQEYIAPSRYEQSGQEYKCDLRFYAYQDQVFLGLARLYQGQTTNFAQPGGGFACLSEGD